MNRARIPRSICLLLQNGFALLVLFVVVHFVTMHMLSILDIRQIENRGTKFIIGAWLLFLRPEPRRPSLRAFMNWTNPGTRDHGFRRKHPVPA
jgi:hypothetical protein